GAGERRPSGPSRGRRGCRLAAGEVRAVVVAPARVAGGDGRDAVDAAGGDDVPELPDDGDGAADTAAVLRVAQEVRLAAVRGLRVDVGEAVRAEELRRARSARQHRVRRLGEAAPDGA